MSVADMIVRAYIAQIATHKDAESRGVLYNVALHHGVGVDGNSDTVEESNFAEEQVADNVTLDEGATAALREVGHGDAGRSLINDVSGDGHIPAARDEDAA